MGGGNYFTDYLPVSRCWLVWHKPDIAPSMADCELAWVSKPGNARLFKQSIGGMNPERVDHPTQKPLSLMKWVLINYTNPGDTILDPFMGNGTTGVAAVKTGRNFIGIEIEPRYFAIAERRIAEAKLQIRMDI